MNRFEIAKRRQQVLTLLAKGFDQSSIATSLHVSQPTIHRDIEALKKDSKDFVNEMARYFGFYYQQTIQGIDEALSEIWTIHHNSKSERIKLQAMAQAIDGCVKKANMIADGPTVVSVQKLGEKHAKAKEHT